jgi:hypothetical protein
LHAQYAKIIGFSEQENRHIQMTLELMTDLGFKVRDTFKPDKNLDDFHSNGRKYDFPRLFHIEWVNTTDSGYAEVHAKRAYTLDNYTSQAYDAYTILIPTRFKDQSRDDPIMHECVHFLQHANREDERDYVHYDGKNYMIYVSQRTEFEAHMIQILYIVKTDQARLRKQLSPGQIQNLERMFLEYRNTHDKALGVNIIILCKNANLI